MTPPPDVRGLLQKYFCSNPRTSGGGVIHGHRENISAVIHGHREEDCASRAVAAAPSFQTCFACVDLVSGSHGRAAKLGACVNWVDWLRTSADKRMWSGRRAVVMVR